MVWLKNWSTVINVAFAYWSGVTISRASSVIVNAKIPLVMRSRFTLLMGSEIAMVHQSTWYMTGTGSGIIPLFLELYYSVDERSCGTGKVWEVDCPKKML